MKILKNLLAIYGAYSLVRPIIDSITGRAINNFVFDTGKPRFAIGEQAGKVVIYLPITIINKNFFQIEVYSFSGSLFYGSYNLGEIMLPQTFLASGQSITREARIVVDLTQFGLNITDMINTSNYLGVLKIKDGMLYTNIINVPINQNIQIA